jgi:hypothetical protein
LLTPRRAAGAEQSSWARRPAPAANNVRFGLTNTPSSNSSRVRHAALAVATCLTVLSPELYRIAALPIGSKVTTGSVSTSPWKQRSRVASPLR